MRHVRDTGHSWERCDVTDPRNDEPRSDDGWLWEQELPYLKRDRELNEGARIYAVLGIALIAAVILVVMVTWL